MTDKKIAAIGSDEKLPPDRAAIVAELRALTKQVILGEVEAVFVLYRNNRNEFHDDLLGDINDAVLHMQLHTVMIELVEESREPE